LKDLPDRPEFVFCATDMVFGVNWIFKKDSVGDYQAGFHRSELPWPLADAVASSSCFPPVFSPWKPPIGDLKLEGGEYQEPDRDHLVKHIRLSDGGVYDNMGTEPIWKDHETVIVSDGGAPFRYDISSSTIKRMSRFFSVMTNQSASLRKRWLISSMKKKIINGAYWGIGSATSSYPGYAKFGYSKSLAKKYISNIRTDLNIFSDPEKNILENHGYHLACVSVQNYLAKLDRTGKLPETPHMDWLAEKKVEAALKESHMRKILWWKL